MMGPLEVQKGVNSEEIDDQGFEFDADLYREVSCAAKLREIRLLDSSYSIKVELFDDFDKAIEMRHSFSGSLEECALDKDVGVASGCFTWGAEVKYKRKKSLKLSAKYLVRYSELEGCDENHIFAFFTKVGRFATYPYFRALFSNLTSESGLILPPLPALNERVD
ncbi:hypothetical protein [Rhodovulum sulfidophilum]|uniref:Uncharacterized protein n=1 Tax=Rhodovulum sulfidophilum TaxID=35806 RepID=A0ABS1RQA3_RHOSU|nr:hypothetical protein [Rhodovulum sulfidophilum]MBL3608234.1 hypothetical protein [Rhodovulum sulfidophilum]MCE8457973.1 hypothetical protein [Rhodovulum sulfidophilum]